MSNLDPQTALKDIPWTEEATERLQRAPIFLRSMVKRLAEKKAREMGEPEITAALLDRFKQQMMGSMGGASELAEAADQMEKGKLPWTAEARKRLQAVPEFMQAMIQQIAEEVARERGHMEVNVELFEKVEAMGDQPEESRVPLDWSEGAKTMLQEKIKNSPPIAMEFVTDMLKRDAEDLAREAGLPLIDEPALRRIWETPQEQVAWTDEAWKRLHTSPDFVRSGIRKAAERRARKLGLKEIDSDHLTIFRNEAMMKAVKRIRSFGYKELTFDAFDDAMVKVKRLKGNDQAEQRLSEIREFMTKEKPEVGVLGEDLMNRFRQYLKGEGKL